MSEVKKSVYETLRNVNVDDKIKKLEGLNYLPWANAWDEILQKYPDANYEVVFFNGEFYKYDTNTGYMVMTNMTIGGITRTMWLPVLNGAKKPMKTEAYSYTIMAWKDGKKVQQTKTVEPATMFDINKTLMRCLVKNAAMFGMGLYIYEKEENWEDPNSDTPETPKPMAKTDIKPTTKPVTKAVVKPAVEKPKEETPKTAPTATANTSAPIKPVAAAANVKVEPAPSDKPELTEDHPNYLKVIAYTKANAKFGIDQIAKALGGKYTITDEIKEKLNAIIKAANEPENN